MTGMDRAQWRDFEGAARMAVWMYKVKHSKLLTRNDEEIDFNVAESVGTQSLCETQTKTVCVKPAFGDGVPNVLFPEAP